MRERESEWMRRFRKNIWEHWTKCVKSRQHVYHIWDFHSRAVVFDINSLECSQLLNHILIYPILLAKKLPQTKQLEHYSNTSNSIIININNNDDDDDSSNSWCSSKYNSHSYMNFRLCNCVIAQLEMCSSCFLWTNFHQFQKSNRSIHMLINWMSLFELKLKWQCMRILRNITSDRCNHMTGS